MLDTESVTDTCWQNRLGPNLWVFRARLVSALQREHRCHGFESPWSPEIFFRVTLQLLFTATILSSHRFVFPHFTSSFLVSILSRPAPQCIGLQRSIGFSTAAFWYRSFSVMWSTALQIAWNKRKFQHVKRVQFPQDFFLYTNIAADSLFCTQKWRPWRHVKTIYSFVLIGARLSVNHKVRNSQCKVKTKASTKLFSRLENHAN